MINIISFSSRDGGNCEQIGEFIYSNYNRTNVSLYKFSELMIHSCGNCRYECFVDNKACPYIDDDEFGLLDAICCSNLTFFIVPNYCDYPCANFFIFNERSLCSFQNHPEKLDQYLSVKKKFIVVSNTGIERFTEAFTQHTNGAPDVLVLSAKTFGKRSIDGDIMKSEQAKAVLTEFLQSGT